MSYSKSVDLTKSEAPQWKDDLLKSDAIHASSYSFSALSTISKRQQSPLYSSIGLFTNEAGDRGGEFNFGHKNIYGVFNVSAMESNKTKIALGLGSFIPLSKWTGLYPTYTFARTNDFEDMFLTLGQTNIKFFDAHEIVAKYNQFKLMSHFRISGKIDIQVGPTFNFVRTEHHFYLPDVIFINTGSGVNGRISHVVARTPDEYSTSNKWVGLELGMSYRINFQKINRKLKN